MAFIFKIISAFDQNDVQWQWILKFSYYMAFMHFSHHWENIESEYYLGQKGCVKIVYPIACGKQGQLRPGCLGCLGADKLWIGPGVRFDSSSSQDKSFLCKNRGCSSFRYHLYLTGWATEMLFCGSQITLSVLVYKWCPASHTRFFSQQSNNSSVIWQENKQPFFYIVTRK